MPIALSENQVLYLQNNLQAAGLDYVPLCDELLDHLCCMVEERMTMGLNFQQACEDALTAFGKDEIQELQNETIHLIQQKSQFMKRISLLVLAILLVSVTIIWASRQDPPSTKPLEGDFLITSDFGMRMHPIFNKMKLHKGVDFRAPIGTPVQATSDGEIIEAVEQQGGYGNYIIIKHDESFETLYSQLSEIKVIKGQKIKKGEVIGLSGNSGTSTAPHLHYEVRKDGKSVDPADFFGP